MPPLLTATATSVTANDRLAVDSATAPAAVAVWAKRVATASTAACAACPPANATAEAKATMTTIA